MEAFLVITCIVSFVSLIIIVILTLCKIEVAAWVVLLNLFVSMYSMITIVLYGKSPKPIDVYRGKTELKIDGYYMDTDSSMTFIPTDSTVVFKN